MSDIPLQIEKAFLTKPNLGGTIHGVRKLKLGAPNTIIHSFKSAKCGGTLRLEGCFEKAFALVLEADRTIMDFRGQALKVILSATEYAIPDFLVKKACGTLKVFEVKPDRQNLTPEQLERFATLEHVLALEGIEFQLVEGKHLKNDFDTNRIIKLYTDGHRRSYTATLKNFAKDILAQTHFATLAEVHTTLTQASLPFGLAQYLVFHKEITTTDSEKLLDFSGVTL